MVHAPEINQNEEKKSKKQKTDQTHACALRNVLKEKWIFTLSPRNHYTTTKFIARKERDPQRKWGSERKRKSTCSTIDNSEITVQKETVSVWLIGADRRLQFVINWIPSHFWDTLFTTNVHNSPLYPSFSWLFSFRPNETLWFATDVMNLIWNKWSTNDRTSIFLSIIRRSKYSRCLWPEQ